jgi:hypothetical protein
MAKRDIQDLVCKPFCSFYREGVKEEMICNGARLLEILMKKGVLSREAISGVKPVPCLDAVRNTPMGDAVCRDCPFLRDDCDFRSGTPPQDAEPCGGFILLAMLAANGVVSMEELTETDNE